MILPTKYKGPKITERLRPSKYTTVLDADSNSHVIGNVVVNSSGTLIRVADTVLDSDGNSFTLFA